MSYQTKLLTGDQAVTEAVTLLKQGECVGLPSETVYGLAADAKRPEAVNKIFAAKGRPANHPLIVHLPDASHIDQWAINLPSNLEQLAAQFWPGPLTLLLTKHPDVPSEVTGGLDTVAVRVPAHPDFLKVLKAFGSGLAAPSANPYKKLSPTTPEQVMYGLKGRIAGILDGGRCDFGLESTILDMVSAQPTILRAGPISRQQISACLGQPVSLPQAHTQVVPGNVEAHYQPETPLLVLSDAQITAHSLTDCELVLWSPALAERLSGQARLRLLGDDPVAFGRALYYTLHQIDQAGAKQIIVQAPPAEEAWRAISDRLARAQSKLNG